MKVWHSAASQSDRGLSTLLLGVPADARVVTAPTGGAVHGQARQITAADGRRRRQEVRPGALGLARVEPLAELHPFLLALTARQVVGLEVVHVTAFAGVVGCAIETGASHGGR